MKKIKMKRCIKCKRLLSNSSKVCTKCGSIVINRDDQNISKEDNVPNNKKQ